jgi:hypothetical protein
MSRPESRPDRLGGAAGDLATRLAAGRTRRSFLGRLGAAALGAVGGRAVAAAVAPDVAEARYYGFCGHTWTTGSCPSPFHLPRIDRHGLPVRPRDGRPVDNLGRLIDRHGLPVDRAGHRLLGPDGAPLQRAPRTRICQDWVPETFGVDAHLQGAWYRCCGGQIRKLWDCCSRSTTRINGDEALSGYCYGDRRVFCVTYRDTGIPC